MTNVQVEAVYADALVAGTPTVQVEAVYADALVAGTPTIQVESLYVDVLTFSTTLVSASTSGASNPAAYAFDSDSTTQWLSSGEVSGAWLKAVYATPGTFSSYSVGGTVTGSTTKAPKTWKLQGSDDGSSWTDLDTQTNAPAWSASEIRNYALSQGYTFTQWRLLFTAAQSDPSTVGVSLFDLFAPAVAAPGGTPFNSRSPRRNRNSRSCIRT